MRREQRLKRFIYSCKISAMVICAFFAGAACYHLVNYEPEPYVWPKECVYEEHGIEDISICYGSSESETDLEEIETDYIENETIPEITETKVAPVQQCFYDIPLSEELQAAVKELTYRYELPYELILAMIMTESSGKPESIGDGGASVGLMQVQSRWWQWMADANGLDLNEPVDNVECGILIILLLLEENNGRMDKALTAYNCGNPDNEENMYFEKVLLWMDKLEELERGPEHDG